MKPFLLSLILCNTLLSSSSSQEPCLKKAWEAYDQRNWRIAIQHAEDCKFNFGPKARQIQKQLESSGYKLPDGYDVPNKLSAQHKDEIFSDGLLNDVAASYWIAGMSNLQLGNKAASKEAFKKAIELSLGLNYDPIKNLFWSPSNESKLQLDELK